MTVALIMIIIRVTAIAMTVRIVNMIISTITREKKFNTKLIET